MCDRAPEVGRNLPEPRGRQLLRTSATVSPSPPPATGSIVHVSSGLPRCTPTTSTTPSTLPSISSTWLAGPASTSGSSPKIFTSIGVGIAFEIAQHVLQQLDELDLGGGCRLRQLVAKIRDHLFRRAVALRARLESDEHVAAVLLGREQPQLGTGTARGSTRPRVSSASTFSIFSQLTIGLLQRASRRASGSRRRSRLRQLWQETASDGEVQRPAENGQQTTAPATASAGRPMHRPSVQSTTVQPRRQGARLALRAWIAHARQQRNQRHREHERQQHRDRQASCDSARKNCPETPDNRPSGANTTTVVNVELTTGAISSAHRVGHARRRPPPPRRWMFSTTTTASSMTRPIATARPPIDIRLIDPPNTLKTTNVGMTASGSVTAAIAVSRAVPQEDQQHDRPRAGRRSGSRRGRWRSPRARIRRGRRPW